MGDPQNAIRGPGDLGIAVDIGTTTIAAYLVDLGNEPSSPPRVRASTSRLNSQLIFGADEFQRIEYSMRTDRGVDELSRLVRSDVCSLADELLSRVGAEAEALKLMSAVGSATMLRLFAARHPSRGEYESLGCESIMATDFDLPYSRCRLVVAASATLGIGADLLAAIRAAGLEELEEPTLLIDLGSKGSIALGDRDGICCCVNSAGPPFEGPSFSCGTGGVSGAVDSLTWGPDGLLWTSLSGDTPTGLCCSGLIDAASCLVRASAVDASGALDERWWSSGYPLVRSGLAELNFTQADLRQIQLAKASVATGIGTLLAKRGIGYDEVDRVLISGSFGGMISPESTAVIGLLPRALLDRASSIGNASGAGALRLLSHTDEKERIDALSERCIAVDTSASPFFDKRFADELLFPAADAVLEAVRPDTL
jgi:uncharacterized 2Fe-2S/4Fe-4S cluster protein (DUF4445 family)